MWVTITVQDLINERLSRLVNEAQSSADAAGEPDPIPSLIGYVTDELRGCIGFHHPNQIDATAGSIPATLRMMAVQKVARLLKQKLQAAQTDDDKADEKTWQDRLKLITQGHWPIDPTDNPMTTPAAQDNVGGAELARGTPRRFTPHSLRGL